ncbi:paeninodin family lasso peptide [Alteribacter natronophilus]|uniref:paeninodin family lasso peptide n=1 Tax=Alteribacter natronophilus TaxID=2583810 RepID=UPI00110F6844|nr:paeninodin family lasso peptide [Alteribacter natronophilus]TMW70535.1 paeninodin family lasso peptide [Alteribacter natronophilus]
MKKRWSDPELDVLNVKMTAGGLNYSKFDSDFEDDTDIPTDENGNPLISRS